MFGDVIFFVLFAWLLALIEIEVEGKYGWAEKIPTWYQKRGFLGRLFGLISFGRPITGYHLFVFLFTIFAFHSGFFLGLSWTFGTELKIIALYFIWVCLWDFSWFVFNPYYGIKNFKKQKIWWFSKSPWVFNLFPLDYFLAIIFSFIIAIIANSFESSVLEFYISFLLSFIIFAIIAIIISPFYHRFYRSMRKKDDRGISGVFHKL